jgi:thiol-disulfide isomerase/thioredoxin
MRGNILNRPEIVAELKNFVLLELYTDGIDAASDANSKMQQDKYGTVSLPFYVIIDPDEKLLAKYEGLTHDAAAYLAFLKSAPAPAAAPTPAAPAKEAETPAAAAPTKTTAAPAGTAIGPFTKVGGGAFDTSSLSGKVSVVNFWATWCIPCRGELPAFNKIYKEMSSKGVAMLAVNLDEDASPVPGFLQKNPIDFPVAIGSQETWKQYKLENLPVTLVLDRAGKLVQRFDGAATESELQSALDKALK